ncbi:MAG: hypothetical protein RLZZ237_3500 [Pseudomonadota bacterium]|jgi:hypothetical protein
MKLQSLILAAVLAVSAGGVYAADNKTVDVTLAGSAPQWTAHFGADHVADSFIDTFTFGPATGDFLVNGGFVNISVNRNQFIEFLSATLNGVALQLYATSGGGSTFSGAASVGDLATTAPLVLTITGISRGITSYGGNFNIVAVPEPATYGMLLAGLGLIGYAVRRRRS